MLALDPHVVNRSTRIQALGLLCAVVRHQPPHLYAVLQTPLIEHLLKCLMIDTSHTVISLALTNLLMLLPHIPSSVIAHLPRLFLIYSRLLCWERLYPPRLDEENDDGQQQEEPQSPVGRVNPVDKSDWETLEPSSDGGDFNMPELADYFTFLYGLYPLNFMSYVRKPRKYLKNINFPRADEFDLDQDLIRKRTEHYQSLHILHPNFFKTTAEDELTDDTWLKSDPADVIALCMGLCLISPEPLNGPLPAPITGLPDIPPAYLDTEDIPAQSLLSRDDDVPTPLESTTTTPDMTPASQRYRAVESPGYSSPLLRARAKLGDSPSLSPTMRPARKDFFSTQSGSVSTMSTLIEGGPTRNHGASNSVNSGVVSKVEGSASYLQREIMLLRNDLNFERYLKQQHILHVGQLQRQHMKEATIEADTAKLINTNRTLKAKLIKTNDAYALLKKETANDRANHRRRENEQNVRMRMLRDAEKKYHEEELLLRNELSKFKTDCKHLSQLVVQSEAKELLSRQKQTSMETELEKLDTLRARVTDLEAQLLVSEKRELAYAEANRDREALQTELGAAKLRLQSRASGEEGITDIYNRRIAELELKLRDAQLGKNGHNTIHVQQLIDSATATLGARYAALRKEYAKLHQQYGEIKIRCEELEQDAQQNLPALQAGWSTDPVDDDDETEDDDLSSLAPSRGQSSADLATLTMASKTPRYQVPTYAVGTISPPPLRPPPTAATNTAGGVDVGGTNSARSPPGHYEVAMGLGRTASAASGLSQQGPGSISPNDTRTRGLYASGRSAFSTDSLAASATSDQSKGSSMATGGSARSKETTEERKRREKKEKGLAKTGGFRGIRGIM